MEKDMETTISFSQLMRRKRRVVVVAQDRRMQREAARKMLPDATAAALKYARSLSIIVDINVPTISAIWGHYGFGIMDSHGQTDSVLTMHAECLDSIFFPG